MQYPTVLSCESEQFRVIYGFGAQIARKARATRDAMSSRFVGNKQVERKRMTASNQAAIAHLNLSEIPGSERQIG
ncbi:MULTISPECIES: hypothetical protein [unclassified Sphingomonas]|uniref:hypothetical protein n=1 Tax=unclassified Sphingomonas TaxID=196159 RepID=UPI0012E329A3|nr:MULTISPECIES: hypothetical protein [unclassified Sphingomonas]